ELVADQRPGALLLLALGGLGIAAKEDSFEERPVVVVGVDEDGDLTAGPHAFGARVLAADVDVEGRLAVEDGADWNGVWLAVRAGRRMAARRRGRFHQGR